jgi:hypothetical protein
MAYYFAEGSKFYFSETFAASKTITILTNANPALATATSHGYADNDEVLLTSGWEDATDTIYRVDGHGCDAPFAVLVREVMHSMAAAKACGDTIEVRWGLNAQGKRVISEVLDA